MRMRHAPCGYTKYSCVFHTSTCQKISRRPLLLIESELPDTLLFRGAPWDKCKMESGKFPAARCRGGACPSRRNAADWYRLSIKTRKPIASVAALTAQPLAALPPYGCGVPLAGCERPWQLQIPVYPADRTGHQICHCEGALRPWQSREGTYVFADGSPVIQSCPARFPRRFAPRNDNSGTPARSTMPLPA